ncbi:glycoside hydrolase family 15 protein [Streptomyces chiangmaiensis]
MRKQLGTLSPSTRDFLADVADAAARDWEKPDHGIWEVRGKPRHFLHSKLMCWVALDRAVAMADQLHAGHRESHWAATAEKIRKPSSRKDGTRRPRRSPNTSAPPIWTRRL